MWTAAQRSQLRERIKSANRGEIVQITRLDREDKDLRRFHKTKEENGRMKNLFALLKPRE